jgi:toxin ParE1/3/4
MGFRLTARARRDILRIWAYIADDNESAADRFVDLRMQQFQTLGHSPRIGRQRDELRAGYRSFPVGEYLILYRIGEPGVRIMHVVHGRRDLDTFFRHG